MIIDNAGDKFRYVESFLKKKELFMQSRCVVPDRTDTTIPLLLLSCNVIIKTPTTYHYTKFHNLFHFQLAMMELIQEIKVPKHKKVVIISFLRNSYFTENWFIEKGVFKAEVLPSFFCPRHSIRSRLLVNEPFQLSRRVLRFDELHMNQVWNILIICRRTERRKWRKMELSH